MYILTSDALFAQVLSPKQTYVLPASAESLRFSAPREWARPRWLLSRTFPNGRPDICKIILRTRVKGSCMKPAPLHSQEPDLYSFQRCSAEKATTTAVVVDSSDEMSDKQQSDDSSTHSSASASTLGPQPTGTPKEIQTPLEGTISDDEKFPPFTTSMSLHIVSDEQNSAAATDVLVLDPLAPSSWDSPIESAPLTTSVPIPLAVTSQFPSLSAEFPFSLPSWQTAEEIRPLLPNVVGCEDQFRRRVSCDEQGVFEGRSFQCIDEATLRNMEAILISEG